MTDEEWDARVTALSDEDVAALADKDSRVSFDLRWYRNHPIIMRLAKEVLALRALGLSASGKALADALSKATAEVVFERDRLQAELRGAVTARNIAERERDNLRKQLPDGMQHCTIVFRECEKGHGWLTATNWTPYGCPTCESDRLKADLLAHTVEKVAP